MKRITTAILLLSYLVIFNGCSKNDLILLDALPMFQDDGSPRVLARPESVEVIGNYNYGIQIVWPELSSSVTSADVTFSKEGFSETFNVTNFNNAFNFQADEITEYTISIVYNSKNQSKSQPKILKVMPKDYEVNYIARDVELDAKSGAIKFSFSKYNLKNYSYEIKYVYDGKAYNQTFTSTTDSTDTFVVNDIIDDLFIYNFEIKVKDLDLDLESSMISKDISPLPLAYVQVARNMQISTRFDEIILKWPNTTNNAAKVIVNYTINGVTKTRTKTSSAITDTLIIGGFSAGSHNISIRAESLTGETTAFVSYNQTVASNFIDFTTRALKKDAGWSVTASSVNGAGDGNDPNAVIDGAISGGNVYWQTNTGSAKYSDRTYDGYNGHYLVFALPTYHKFTKLMITNRDHGTQNPYKDFSVWTSEDGINFVKYQSFTNTENGQNKTATFTFDRPVVAKFIRILFESSLPGSWDSQNRTTNNLSVAEVSFSGYKN